MLEIELWALPSGIHSSPLSYFSGPNEELSNRIFFFFGFIVWPHKTGYLGLIPGGAWGTIGGPRN